MPRYKPTTIASKESGLIKKYQQFVLPNDAYVELDNAYVWRGICKRADGFTQLGRMRRVFSTATYFDTGSSVWNIDILQQVGYITNIDIAGAPTLVVTTSYPHGLSNGDTVVISGVVGTTEVNDNTYTVTVVSTTTFQITQAAPSAYTSGGFYYSNRALSGEDNASIECGSVTIVLDTGGTPETLTDNGDGTFTSTGASTATIDYLTGAVAITHAYGTVATTLAYSYYPGLPCMGIKVRNVDAINDEDYVFFDLKYAYLYSAGTFNEFIPGTQWGGDSTDYLSYFYTTNYWYDSSGNELFWATNFFPNIGATGDPMRYTDGTTWTDFTPAVNGSDYLQSALLLIPYRGRLVALNTFEGSDQTAPFSSGTQFPNRARWCQNGDPTDQTNGWLDNIQGRGGYLDAPTTEHIVGAAFVRDTLIVYFERSTWKLRYTGNEILPFVFERINVRLGADSTFSTLEMETGTFCIGDKAITVCDGNQVQRIDDKIIDEVFSIHNGNNGPKRVQGIRNFFEQLIYWSFPSADQDGTFPNRVLIYNYDDQTWGNIKFSLTALGPYQRTDDVRWSDLTSITWEEYDKAWNAGSIQSEFPQVAGGNQQGFVFIFNEQVMNDPSLQITAIATGTPPTITSPDHNLEDGDIIEINDIVGTSSTLNDFRYQVINADQNTFQIQNKPQFTITAISLVNNTITATGNDLSQGDYVQFTGVGGTTELNGRTAKVTSVGNTFTIDLDMSEFTAFTSGGTVENLSAPFEDTVLAGGSTYLGCGVITYIPNFSIRSKKFNNMNTGKQIHLGYIDFLTPITSSGEVSVPIYADYNESQRINPRGRDAFFNWGMSTQAQQFSTVNTNKDWRRFICPLDAQFFQYQITLDEPQMTSKEISANAFEVDAVVIWADEGSRLTN